MGKKFVRGLGLAAALAALTVAAGPAVVAQDKKKKDDAKTSAAKATVKIGEGKDGKFRFSIYDADDVFLGMSGPKGYDTRADAVKGVEAMKAALATAKIVDKPKDGADEKDAKKAKEKDKK